MENILQVLSHFTCKQTPKDGKTFYKKYSASNQTEHKNNARSNCLGTQTLSYFTIICTCQTMIRLLFIKYYW